MNPNGKVDRRGVRELLRRPERHGGPVRTNGDLPREVQTVFVQKLAIAVPASDTDLLQSGLVDSVTLWSWCSRSRPASESVFPSRVSRSTTSGRSRESPGSSNVPARAGTPTT